MTSASENINCLAGMRCPKCKSRGPFAIAATAIFTMTDEGTDSFGDIEYDDGSYCQCTECDHDGIIDEFRQDG